EESGEPNGRALAEGLVANLERRELLASVGRRVEPGTDGLRRFRLEREEVPQHDGGRRRPGDRVPFRVDAAVLQLVRSGLARPFRRTTLGGTGVERRRAMGRAVRGGGPGILA